MLVQSFRNWKCRSLHACLRHSSGKSKRVIADAWKPILGTTRVAAAGVAICFIALSACWHFGQVWILTASWCRALCRQLSRELSRKLSQVGEDVPEWLKRELPPPPRRERLPAPKQREKSVSLWSIIKECVGKDLSRVCLPVFFNEPLSSLQRIAEEMEYSELLDEVRLHREISSKALLMLVSQCLCETCPCFVQAYHLILAHAYAWWHVIATMPGPVFGRVPRQCGCTQAPHRQQ